MCAKKQSLSTLYDGGFFSSEILGTVTLEPSEVLIGCDKCGLYKSCISPKMSYSGEGKKQILIIADVPSTGEDFKGVPLSGDSGIWFKEKMSKKGINVEKDCWYINVIGCKTAKPTKNHVKNCKFRVINAIKELKPKYIILMGDNAVYSMYSEREHKCTADRWRGLCIPNTEYNAWILPIYEPVYAIKMEKDDHFQKQYDRDLAFVARCTKADYEPESMDISGAKILRNFGEVTDLLNKIIFELPDKLAFDYETTGLKPYRDAHRIATISCCFDENNSYAFPYQYNNHFTLEQQIVIGKLWLAIMEEPKIKKIAHNCFSGDTEYITKEGIKTFANTVGTKQEVWTQSGWILADIKCFGYDNLSEITIGPSHRSRSNSIRKIKCTENHRWFIDRKKTTQYTTKENVTFWKRMEKVHTSQLKHKDRIIGELPFFAINQKSDGFRHGLIFADGCMKGQTKSGLYTHQIRLCGNKSIYKDSFPKYTYPNSANGDPVVNHYVNKINMKELPKKADAEYIANFIEGWQLLDGTNATTGESRVVTTVDKESAFWLKENASLGGWYCTGICECVQKPNSYSTESKPYWMVSISKDKSMGWTVKKIKKGVSYELVYCAVVPTEQFTLNHGVYTSNSKYEDMWTREMFGVDMANYWWCTMNTAHIIDNRSEFSGLKFQALIRWDVPDYDSSIEKYLKSDKETPFNNIMQAPLNDLLLYNSLDSLLTYRLQLEQEQELSDFPDMEKARRFFMDGLHSLCDMQENGIPLNRTYYDSQDELLGNNIITMTEKLYTFPEALLFKKTRGRDINFGSNTDLSDLFFKVLNLSPTKTTSGGNASVDASVLAELDTPIAKEITKIAKLKKIKGTYLGQFRREIEEDNKLHPFFDLHTVQTFRGSSNSPNFQNIPVRDADAMNITRGGVIPTKGNMLIDWDYGSMEVRIIACYTEDPVLMKYIQDPTTDMHRDQAMDWFCISKELWDATDKKHAKNIRFEAKGGMVFALFYGSYFKSIARSMFPKLKNMPIGDSNLFEHLRSTGIINSLSTAQSDFENHTKRVEQRFWNKYKGVKNWQEKTMRSYLEKGYIEQFFGFRNKGWLTRNDICNYPIQGTAFHCLVWSIHRLIQRMKDAGMDSQLIAQIHDCCLADIVPTEKDAWCKLSFDIATKEIRDIHKWIIVPLDIEFEGSEIDEPWSMKKTFHI